MGARRVKPPTHKQKLDRPEVLPSCPCPAHVDVAAAGAHGAGRAGPGPGPRAWVAGRPRSWPGKWREQRFAPLSWPEGSASPLLGERMCFQLGDRVPEQSPSPTSRTFGEAESGGRKPLLAPVKAAGSHWSCGAAGGPWGPPAQVVAVGAEPLGPFREGGSRPLTALRACSRIKARVVTAPAGLGTPVPLCPEQWTLGVHWGAPRRESKEAGSPSSVRIVVVPPRLGALPRVTLGVC